MDVIIRSESDIDAFFAELIQREPPYIYRLVRKLSYNEQFTICKDSGIEAVKEVEYVYSLYQPPESHIPPFNNDPDIVSRLYSLRAFICRALLFS